MKEAQAKRRSVLRSLSDAADLLVDGSTIAVGGFSVANHPMPLVREIIRREFHDLTIVGSATAGLEVDLLIGAGTIDKLICPYVGAEMYAPVAPCFRAAVEQKTIELYECSEYTLYAGLEARARGFGFMPWKGGVGTSLPDLNPQYRVFRDPIENEEYLAIPPISADWALIHVGIADEFGNGQHLGPRFSDRLLARAADRVMLVAERIVPNEVIRRNPDRTSIPYADVVIEAPYSSHPFAAHGLYGEDSEAIEEYVNVGEALRKGDREAFDAYLDEWVRGVPSHEAYLEKVGVAKLLQLEKAYADIRK